MAIPWAAIAGGVFALSTALGPVTGAALIDGVGYKGIVWLQFVATVPAMYIFVRVNRMIANRLSADKDLLAQVVE